MPAPLIAAAYAAGALRTVSGIFGAKSRGDKQRQLIYEAYGRGRKRLDLRQGDVRQSTVESLGARGLAGVGGIRDRGAVEPTPSAEETPSMSLAHRAIVAGARARGLNVGMPETAAGPPPPIPEGRPSGGPRTLGEQQLVDLEHEQQLEQTDLLAQRDAAVDNTRAEGNQSVIDSIGAGINTGLQIYGAGKELGAMGNKTPAPGASSPLVPGGPIGSAGWDERTGIGTIRGAYGIDPLNPVMPSGGPVRLGGGSTVIGEGQSNYDFHREDR